MNLHAVVASAIQAVNPFAIGSLRINTGTYTTTADYKRVPAYSQVDGIPMQVQPLTAKDLRYLDGLNLQGTERAVYLNGSLLGVQRLNQRGGDLLCFDDQVWLTTSVIETWRTGWCKVGVTLQTDEPWDPLPAPNQIVFDGVLVTYENSPVTFDPAIITFAGEIVTYLGDPVTF